MNEASLSIPVTSSGSGRIGMGLVEFIITIALMTACVSLAIDSMLPALPRIGEALHVANTNDTQLVIGVFFFGFGLAQLIFGSLSDTYGRRNILLGGLVFYAGTMFAASWTGSFTLLLTLRFAQGIGAAAVRITTMAIVRDCFGGREMARVMSYVMIVFMIVPIVAPSMGQLIITIATWPWIFIVLGSAGAFLFLWAFSRMKESLPLTERLPLSTASVKAGFRTVLTNRITCGYMIGLTLFTGVISGYVMSVQQVFGEVFAATALGIAFANFANGYFVRRFGMRRISHAAVILFTVIATFGFAVSLTGRPSFVFTYVLITTMLVMFGAITTNFTAICLEPMGHLAGTATSITGFVSTTAGALLGGGVGQMFDGTIRPLLGGFALFGALTIVAVLWAERGRLFSHPGDDPKLEPGAGGH
jgi:DHA1 family bicyclomycin/chloramphenicol resistance-like MFS transporter